MAENPTERAPRPDAGIDGLRAQTERLAAEVGQMRGRPLFSYANWAPIVLALIPAAGGLATAWTAIQLTDVKREQALVEAERKVLAAEQKAFGFAKDAFDQEQSIAQRKRDLAELTANAADMRAFRANLEAELAAARQAQASAERALVAAQAELDKARAASPDPGTRQSLEQAATSTAAAAGELRRQGVLVYLQFRGDLQRETMRGLQKALVEAGYKAPGIERVGGNYPSKVRHAPAAKQAADDVAGLVGGFFQAVGCPLKPPVAVRPSLPASAAAPVEVWVSHGCSN
jgi:hypothetical protein